MHLKHRFESCFCHFFSPFWNNDQLIERWWIEILNFKIHAKSGFVEFTNGQKSYGLLKKLKCSPQCGGQWPVSLLAIAPHSSSDYRWLSPRPGTAQFSHGGVGGNLLRRGGGGVGGSLDIRLWRWSARVAALSQVKHLEHTSSPQL